MMDGGVEFAGDCISAGSKASLAGLRKAGEPAFAIGWAGFFFCKAKISSKLIFNSILSH